MAWKSSGVKQGLQPLALVFLEIGIVEEDEPDALDALQVGESLTDSLEDDVDGPSHRKAERPGRNGGRGDGPAPPPL